MTTLLRRISQLRIASLAVLVTMAAGCGLDKQSAPALTGPSELGLSLSLTASPQVLPRDGSSPSTITVIARGPSGEPMAGVPLVGGVSPDGAQLTQINAVTDASGRATFILTAPSSSVVAPNNQVIVSVSAVPDGNFDNTNPRTVAVGLLGPANSTAPTADFTFTPPTPDVMQLVVFDASATRDEGVVCDTCTFSWSFGGNGSATGRVVTHAFTVAGTFPVTLTVTDQTGTTSSVTKAVTVRAPTAPTAEFVVSPEEPAVGQTVSFDASTSTVGQGATIETYTWNFGDGSTIESSSSPRTQHSFGAAGTYVVVLTVRDNLGRTASTTQSVEVQ